MPRVTAPRPDEATYGRMVRRLDHRAGSRRRGESESGQASFAASLTRTEYQNSIRDLLAMDAPAERERDFRTCCRRTT